MMNSSTTSASMQKLSAANPYANTQYRHTGWQKFLEALGIRTKYNAWQENMGIQAAEYDAQMALKQYDEEYNLPINQVARMRAAGLNPDLNGGQSVDPGSAAALGDDPSVPMQSTSDSDTLMEFANGIMSCVSMAAGLAGTIENVRGLRLDNVLKSISGEQEMSEYATKIFPFLLPESGNDLFDDEGNFSDNAYGGFLKRAEVFAGQLSPKLRDKFKKQVVAFWNSAPGSAEAKNRWLDNLHATKDLAVDERTNFSWDSKEMAIIADELSKLAAKVEKEGLRSEGAESSYNADYYGSLSGEAAAAAENAENKASTQNSQMEAALRGTLNNIVQRIKNEGGKGSNVLLAVLAMMQLYMAQNGSPSVRRSSTSGVDAKTGRSYSNRTTTLDF